MTAEKERVTNAGDRAGVAQPRTAMMIVFAVVVIDLIGFGIIIPLLPFYGEHFGASPDQIAYLISVYSLCQLISAPVCGRLSDRIGRRPVLVMCLAGTVGAYIWMALVDSLTGLFLARAFAGAMAGSIATAFAYMADITTPENRARGMGLVGAAFGLGFTAGPAIGGILGGADPANINFQLPAYAAAGFSFIAFAAAAALLPESSPREIRDRAQRDEPGRRHTGFMETLRRRPTMVAIGLNFLTVAGIAGIEAMFPIWSEREYGWSVSQNGFLFAYMGLIMAAIQGGLSGPISRRIGEWGMVRLGLAALVVGLIATPLSPNETWMIFAVTIMAVGFGVATPGLNTLVSLSAPEDQQGGVMGVGRSAATVARILGPAAAGILFAWLGRDWPFYMGAVIVGTALIVAFGGRGLNEKPD